MRSLFYLLFLFTTVASAQLHTHAFDDLDALQQKESRPVVVFIHTEWCSYCQLMPRTTLKDPEVMEVLNERFYFISFDAGSTAPVTLGNKTYHYRPTGNQVGQHEIVGALGIAGFPGIVILNPQSNVIYKEASYFNTKHFLQLLTAF